MKCIRVVVAVVVAALGIACAQGPNRAAAQKQEATVLAQLKQQHDSAMKAYQKAPKNAQLKKRYVDVTVKLGMKTMYSESLPPRQKYPGALKYFNEALKVDPTNKDAREQRDMILAVYKSMGKKPGG